MNRIDAKGRVSVPAHFRAVLQKRGYAELYALRALDVAALDVGGMDLLDRYEERIALEDPFLQTADDMSFFCHGDGAFLKLDQDGRITVSCPRPGNSPTAGRCGDAPRPPGGSAP